MLRVLLFLAALGMPVSASASGYQFIYRDTTTFSEGSSVANGWNFHVAYDPSAPGRDVDKLKVYISDLGMGCIDGRYCGTGDFSIGQGLFDQSGYIVYSFAGFVTSVRATPTTIFAVGRLDHPFRGYDYLGDTPSGDPIYEVIRFNTVKMEFGNLTDYRADSDFYWGDRSPATVATLPYFSLTATVPAPASGSLAVGAMLAFGLLRRSRRASAVGRA